MASHASILAGLTQLFTWWEKPHAQIEINTFTFVCTAGTVPKAEMHQLLDNSNLFYFCVIWEMTENLRQAFSGTPLVEHLRCHIHYHQMSFFGVCGGAMMAGLQTHYGCPGLDLFDGFTVHYDANIRASVAQVTTSFEEQVMQMTTGCALAVVMTYDNIAATSFSTINNGSQWFKFCSFHHGSNAVTHK